MKLYFTRHGQTEWNVQERMQGSSDSPLTSLGIEQAEGLREWLEAISIDRVYTSPQPRAFTTAEIALAGKGLSPIPDDRLREARLGAFEGMTFTEATETYPGAIHAFTQAPDQFVPIGEGETFFDLRERVNDFLSSIATERHETVLVVSHALVLLTMRVCMLNLDLRRLREDVYVPACSRCEATYENGRWTLIRFGPPASEGMGKRPF